METWEVEVGHLVRTFADALANLVPSLDRARIVWTPLGDRYDDFDRIAESLYTSIVISPALHDPRLSSLGVDEFRPFGFAASDRWRAEIEVAHADLPTSGALLDLDTDRSPFDLAVVETSAGRQRVDRDEARFVVRVAGEVVSTLTVDQ